MNHCSTAQQRRAWISQLLVPQPAHGLVSQLSRTHQISRQTLYRWKEKDSLCQALLRPIWKAEKNGETKESSMLSNRHKGVYHAAKWCQAASLPWVRFIFLHSSTIVSVADLTHPYISAHNKLILAKK
jgi:hypothetical protein